jgi:hypothetical protein
VAESKRYAHVAHDALKFTSSDQNSGNPENRSPAAPSSNTRTRMIAPIDVAKPVLIDYEELRSKDPKDLFPRLIEAFGDEPQCLGIVVVDMRSVPHYSKLRKTLLSYSSYLAALPAEELQKLENAHAKYVVGWSHGKEKLKNGAVDTRKGTALISFDSQVDAY